MADIIGSSVSALNISARTLRTLRGGASANYASNSALPETLKASGGASRRAVVSSDKVPAMLSASIYIGNNIIGMLKSLKKAVAIAGSSMAYSYASVLVKSGTRVSVGNISADVTRTLARLEELVANTAVGSANILSSTSPDITLKTGQYGGEINISPQPLDLRGLNIEDLDLHGVNGIQDALARLGMAIAIAEQRVSGLQALDKALNGTSFLNSALSTVGATGHTELRGVLVNLFA